MKKELKTASLFSGVGGVDLGFEQAGFMTVYANEIDVYPAKTFEENFGVKVDVRDITTIEASELPDFDVLLAGFPCQAFSLAGKQLGFNDARGTLFFDVARIISERKPRVAFFENVKNLVSHDDGRTFSIITKTLEDLGYRISYKVMNSAKYGNIPQGRERIYIVAFRDIEDFKNFTMPDEIPLTTKLDDVIDFENPVDEKYYYSREKHKFYDELEKSITRKDRIYQWRRKYVRENKNGLIPTLTANMGTGGSNVPLILTSDGRIRKLTPRECFNAQGFSKDYKFPNQSNSRLYKQAGNSVSVPVIKRLAEAIKDSLQ